MKTILSTLASLAILSSIPSLKAADPTLPIQNAPYNYWDWTFESGYLWQVGSNTPINYEIIPTQLTLRGPSQFSLFDNNSGILLMRPRFSLLAQSIVKGPENYYLGFSASPSIEWWLPNNLTSLFFSIGGGFGLVDSTNVEGGQGQDFTLNWFSALGIRRHFSNNWSGTLGAYFQHNSNGGKTDPNPGIDALGFTLGLTRKF